MALLLKGVKYQIWIAFIPLLVFWFLDAYQAPINNPYPLDCMTLFSPRVQPQ